MCAHDDLTEPLSPRAYSSSLARSQFSKNFPQIKKNAVFCVFLTLHSLIMGLYRPIETRHWCRFRAPTEDAKTDSLDGGGGVFWKLELSVPEIFEGLKRRFLKFADETKKKLLTEAVELFKDGSLRF
jgi:hypothetical protein